jgi:cyclophilin family peptidyl-prolyl cis-trans isomerase
LDLDGSNVVFGQVVEGFNVLQKMAAVPTIKPSDTLVRSSSPAHVIECGTAALALMLDPNDMTTAVKHAEQLLLRRMHAHQDSTVHNTVHNAHQDRETRRR